jgi:transketolase
VRRAVVSTLVELADADPRIVLLTGDLGFMALEPFAQRFPDRFFNVGVAEQNMIGIATGLAASGLIPFVYSIATFASLRPYEFIRNGPVRHHLPVRILGIGGGFEYGPAGPTHHALEDVAVMRAQPGMAVMVPADAAQAAAVLRATWDRPGPVYYRLGKRDAPEVPGLNGAFEVGRLQAVRDGSDVAFVTLGPLATEAVAAARLLESTGISCAVLALTSVSPAPIGDLRSWLARVALAVTAEAHYCSGGIGSLVAEVIAEASLPCRLVRCGVWSGPGPLTGSEAWLNSQHGLTAEHLAGVVRAQRA